MKEKHALKFEVFRRVSRFYLNCSLSEEELKLLAASIMDMCSALISLVSQPLALLYKQIHVTIEAKLSKTQNPTFYEDI